MQTKPIIKNVALVVGAVWSLAVSLSGLQLAPLWSRLLAQLPLLLVLLFGLWDNWLWKAGPLLTLARQPNLNGTWFGSYDAEWISDDEERRHKTAQVALVIKQTFTSVSVVLLAEQSSSRSFLHSWRRLESGDFKLNYEYSNVPALQHRQHLKLHDGSTELLVPELNPSHITGEYWTNRLSRGTLTLTRVSTNRATSLDQAKQIASTQQEG